MIKKKKGKWAAKGRAGRPTKSVVGYYNAREYTIDVDGKPFFRAGNSKYDSQLYGTPPSQGVGLNKMKKFCIQTAKEIAKEKKAKYYGVQYERTYY
jgi:hypothetical protein